MPENALYYPYIHVRDAEWLKATLLLFKQVRRMVPARDVEGDTPEIQPFTRPHGGREPLLQPADLGSDRVRRAQQRLIRLLRTKAENPAFLRKFGEFSRGSRSKGQEYGFQIHGSKMIHGLKDTLLETGLAWIPGSREPWDPWQEYVQVHPKVGQVVMATLAIACAKAEGLEIVSDERSLKLHKCLTEQDEEAVFRTFLGGGDGPDEPIEASGAELFQFLITFACDTRALDAQIIAEMGSDREPLDRLIVELNRRAGRIDPMDPGPRRLERLQDEAADILRRWIDDRANMSSFWRRFFGLDSAETLLKPTERIAQKALIRGAGEGFALVSLLGAVPGLAIGVVTRTLRSASGVFQNDRGSPFKYLSMLERGGVTFQYDKLLATRLHSRLNSKPGPVDTHRGNEALGDRRASTIGRRKSRLRT